jgi:hypothetical protein
MGQHNSGSPRPDHNDHLLVRVGVMGVLPVSRVRLPGCESAPGGRRPGSAFIVTRSRLELNTCKPATFIAHLARRRDRTLTTYRELPPAPSRVPFDHGVALYTSPCRTQTGFGANCRSAPSSTFEGRVTAVLGNPRRQATSTLLEAVQMQPGYRRRRRRRFARRCEFLHTSARPLWSLAGDARITGTPRRFVRSAPEGGAS